MSRTYRNNKDADDRRIRVTGIRRNPPDLRRLSRALIELARAQAEQEAAAETEAKSANQAKRDRMKALVPQGDAAEPGRTEDVNLSEISDTEEPKVTR